MCLGAGLLSDTLVRRGLATATVRRHAQLVATAVPALALAALSRLARRPAAASALATLWFGGTSFHSAGAMSVLHAVGRERAGELFVLGNAFAKLGALLAAGGARRALDALGWEVVLAGQAAAYLAAGALLIPLMHRADKAAGVLDAGARKRE